MTLGLALFPRDAQTGDALLRQADAAMYLAKLHKHDRVQWWSLGAAGAEPPERETPFDAYAEVTQALLAKTAGHFQTISGQLIARFYYAELAQHPRTQRILSTMEARLQEDIQVQIEAGEATFGTYLKVLSAPPRRPSAACGPMPGWLNLPAWASCPAFRGSCCYAWIAPGCLPWRAAPGRRARRSARYWKRRAWRR